MRVSMLAPLVSPIREPQLGGSQALVADLALGLTQRGHEVTVFAASGSEIPGVRVVDTGVDPGELRAALFRPGAPSDPALTRSAFERAWALVRREPADVVHNHAFDAPAVELGAGSPVPVVHTLHLPPDPEVASAIRRAEPAAVVAVSASQARAWSAHVTVDEVIRDGVPVGRIPWSSAPGPRALWAGRLSPEKGAAEAVEIARLAGVGLDLVGTPYDEGYGARLLGRWGGEEGVSVHPPLPRPLLWERMAAALAVLCPVRWDEPFGLVAAEAQAAGAPVVGFRRGGLAETVLDGLTGVLVPEGDLEAAARALASAASFDRRGIRRHAEATLDLSRTLDAYEVLYEKVAAWGG